MNVDIGTYSIDIFAGRPLQEFLDQRLAKLVEEVRSVDAMSLDPDSYVEDLVRRYSLSAPVLEWGQMKVSEREELIPAERFPRFGFRVTPGQRYPRQVVSFHVSLRGDQNLLGYRPSTFLLWTYPVRYGRGELAFELVNFTGLDALNREATEIQENIERQRRAVADQIEKFNGSLKNTASAQVSKRLERASALQSLELPIRSAEPDRPPPGGQELEQRRTGRTPKHAEPGFAYDVALSYASEDAEPVDTLAALLRDAGYRVFYDRYESASLWGRDLATHLADVYMTQARYCVVFASAPYAGKVWTNRERQAALARAVKEKGEPYILPVRIDDTEIPGLLPTIRYLDLRELAIEEVFRQLVEKLKRG
jgi:TIR domain